jgi:hypothetical protein
MQRYTPMIFDRCAGGAPVRVVAGWYEHLADNQRRSRLDAAGDLAVAGEMQLPLLPAPPADITAPNPTELPVGAALVLKGYGLEGAAEPNAPLILDLYLAGEPQGAATPLTVTLTASSGAAAPVVLWSDRFAPETTWYAGEIICRRAHLRLPPELPLGAYTLTLATPVGGAPVTDLTVTPSTRSYALPPLALPLDAIFADKIRLAGANITGDAGAGNLTVTLGWHALDTPPTALTAFVHLVGPDGALVAQSDAIPGAYSTTQWAPGEVVVDPHQLALPAGLPRGTYHLVAGLYDPITGARWPVIDSTGAAFPDQAVPIFTGELP